jgi:hypothetical protein
MFGERKSISEIFHAQLVQEAQLFRSRAFWITMLIGALAVILGLTVPVTHSYERPIQRGIDPVGINPHGPNNP